MIKTLLIYLTVLSIAFASCNNSTNNTNSFTNIDSALNYSSETKQYKSLLFALVTKDIENNQKLGWAILGDKDIIEVAKKDYVLIIIDPTKIILPKGNDTKEFENIVKNIGESPYFVVTNHVLYPFRQFTLKTGKTKIIDELNVGEGP